jgi:hypothetical protein
MATRYKLQWLADSSRWRKQYKGKQYYFPLRPGETKLSSYRRCLCGPRNDHSLYCSLTDATLLAPEISLRVLDTERHPGQNHDWFVTKAHHHGRADVSCAAPS